MVSVMVRVRVFQLLRLQLEAPAQPRDISPLYLPFISLYLPDISQVEEVLRTRKDLFKRKVQGVRPGDPLANPDPDPDPNPDPIPASQ